MINKITEWLIVLSWVTIVILSGLLFGIDAAIANLFVTTLAAFLTLKVYNAESKK